MRKIVSSPGFLFLLVLFSCKSDKPEFSPIPKIELLSFGPQVAKEFTDSIYFSISYEDGDGDLGENSAEAKNLTLIDNRADIKYQFRIKELVPNGAAIPIKGSLSFSLSGTPILNGNNEETFDYSIYITDRANNKSNTITTPKIKVVI